MDHGSPTRSRSTQAPERAFDVGSFMWMSKMPSDGKRFVVGATSLFAIVSIAMVFFPRRLEITRPDGVEPT
jgi:hypothetical protein